MTLLLTVTSLFFGIVIGLALALIQESRTRTGPDRDARLPVAVCGGTPGAVPGHLHLQRAALVGIKLSAFVCAVLALSLNEGAYMAEILRSACRR